MTSYNLGSCSDVWHDLFTVYTMDKRQIGGREKFHKFKKNMSSSDSDGDETGISNPTFNDETTSNFPTNSSDNTNSKITYLKPKKKPSPSVEETSFTTSTEKTTTTSTPTTTKAEKPYESERIKPRRRTHREQNTETTTTSTKSTSSLTSSLSLQTESTSQSVHKKPNKTLPRLSSLENSSTSSTKKLKKTKKKSSQPTDNNSNSNTTESLIQSSSSRTPEDTKTDENPSKKTNKTKTNEELSSGEVIFTSNKPKKKLTKRIDLKNIPEESTDQTSSEPKTKPKPKRKKRKEISTESAPESAADDEILAILIHRIDGFKMHYFISHPLVQVHLFDLNSGTYVAKLKNSTSVTSYYEEESSPVGHILPVMTQPFEMKGKSNMTPEWQELIVFNEKMSYFLKGDPNVLVFFEVLDFISMAQASKQYEKLGKDGGWHRVAWAFLKMFGWWNNNSKKKYPYTLYVTVKGIEVPHVQPGLRSMIPTQEEKGRTTVVDMQRILEGKSPSLSEERPTASQSEMNYTHWSRLPNQLCKIPNKLIQKIHVGKSASCFVVKFSSSGRFLACGAMEKSNTHSIFIYEIPSGEFKSKCCSHFGIVYDLAWDSSDNLLLSSSADCTARLWQLEKGKSQHCKILPHPSYVYSAKFHPRTCRVIVTACYDHVVRVWDSAKEECELMQELSQHVKFVNAVCFDNEGDVLFSGDGVGTVCVWNVYVTSQPNKPALTRDWTLKQTAKPKELHCKIINDIIAHPGGRRILITTRDNCLRLFDSRDFTLIQKYDGHQNMVDFIHSAISPCGSLIFTGSEDGCIYVWNTNSGTSVHTFRPPSSATTVCSVHYHPHEHMFASCSYGENMPVLLYFYEPDAQSITLQLHDTSSLYRPPIALPALPSSGILKFSNTQITNISSSSEILSTASQNEAEETETSDESKPSQWKPKLTKLKTRLAEKSSSTSLMSSSVASTIATETSDRSRTVTFQDEVQPTTSRWQKVLDKLNGIVESSSKTSNLSEESSIDTTGTRRSSSTSKSSTQFKVVSLHSYKARNESELNLKPGDVVCVSKEMNGNWWEGILADGTRGIFPANYVYRIEETSASVEDSSDSSKRMKRVKTHAIVGTSGAPIFISASEDETMSSHS